MKITINSNGLSWLAVRRPSNRQTVSSTQYRIVARIIVSISSSYYFSLRQDQLAKLDRRSVLQGDPVPQPSRGPRLLRDDDPLFRAARLPRKLCEETVGHRLRAHGLRQYSLHPAILHQIASNTQPEL